MRHHDVDFHKRRSSEIYLIYTTTPKNKGYLVKIVKVKVRSLIN